MKGKLFAGNGERITGRSTGCAYRRTGQLVVMPSKCKDQKGKRRMSYPSVDQLQKVLTEKVFHYAKDSKKAAGRALGTIVEIITFYALKSNHGALRETLLQRGRSRNSLTMISENHNKELKVLAQSYDWLLFLTDAGISQFIDELLFNPAKELIAAKESFLTSYTGKKGVNQFTKV